MLETSIIGMSLQRYEELLKAEIILDAARNIYMSCKETYRLDDSLAVIFGPRLQKPFADEAD